MAQIQYETVVKWDATLRDVGFADADLPSLAGLAINALKITSGAPAATAGQWLPGAMVSNVVTGIVYQMTGTTASPAWSAMENSGSGFTLPVAETDAATTTTTSFAMVMSALTTGIAESITAALLTTGTIFRAVAAQAVLTTGRYFQAFNGAVEVWGIGANGHIHSTVSANPPTIAPTTPNGITACDITAGGTDTCGVITTTGTQDGSGDTVLDVTFGKTYTTAPKSVMLTPVNAAASKAAATSLLTAYVSARSATGFTITIPEDASAIATPSFMYQVIA